MPGKIIQFASFVPNSERRDVPDEDLIRGFELDLGASGRKPKTLEVYIESVRMLSRHAEESGIPGLQSMDRHAVRHWMMSLHEAGNKPATVHVRYRSVNRFFKWLVQEEERDDNPLDNVTPPKLPDKIQPYYTPDQVDTVLKAVDGFSEWTFRDKAIVLTLFDTGVRASELCGMQITDIDWKKRTILVTGKASKQRYVSMGHKSAQAIERYYRRRRNRESEHLWLTTHDEPFTTNGLRMMLQRRFKAADIEFHGAHGFRRGFAMAFLAAGGQEGDLKELGSWESYEMVSRYAKGNAGERAVRAHKQHSPADQLNIRR